LRRIKLKGVDFRRERDREGKRSVVYKTEYSGNLESVDFTI
jgi:hypothetical protein